MFSAKLKLVAADLSPQALSVSLIVVTCIHVCRDLCTLRNGKMYSAYMATQKTLGIGTGKNRIINNTNDTGTVGIMPLIHTHTQEIHLTFFILGQDK